MHENTLLISYKTLTLNSELNDNIDTKIILPLIKEVQEIEVQKITGVALFEKLKALVSTNELNGKYKQLMDEKIRPVLINGILTELPFKLNYRFTNNGIASRTAENATVPDFKDLQKVSDMYKAKKVYYANKLADYLKENESDFPELKENTNSKDEPKSDTFFTGIYLG
jgi:hypothetical protein